MVQIPQDVADEMSQALSHMKRLILNTYIMKIIKQIPVFIILAIVLSCGGETEEHKTLHHASEIHLEAMKIKKEMEPDLDQLRQLSNSIQIQGRALTPEEINFTKAVSTLERRLEFWEENHVEVPGFEHEGHDHSGHNHDHNHAPEFQFPASDLLIIQKEFRDSIIAIKGKLGSLLQQAPK